MVFLHVAFLFHVICAYIRCVSRLFSSHPNAPSLCIHKDAEHSPHSLPQKHEQRELPINTQIREQQTHGMEIVSVTFVCRPVSIEMRYIRERMHA